MFHLNIIPGELYQNCLKVGARNDPFYFVKDTSGEYKQEILDTGMTVIPPASRIGFHFYNTIYSWDIDKLLQMIKVSEEA